MEDSVFLILIIISTILDKATSIIKIEMIIKDQAIGDVWGIKKSLLHLPNDNGLY